MVVRESYPIVGRRWDQLEAAMQMLGPCRHGVRFPAFTDWRLSWHYRLERSRGRHALRDIEVHVVATVILPDWITYRHGNGALRARWAEYLESLESHEMGHVATADEAATRLARELTRIPPQHRITDLETWVQRVVHQVHDAALARDRRLDTVVEIH